MDQFKWAEGYSDALRYRCMSIYTSAQKRTIKQSGSLVPDLIAANHIGG